MSTFKSYRNESRADWGIEQDGSLTIEQINCGAILRIADATEKMAESYDRVRNQRDYYESRAKSLGAEVDRLVRQRNALRGVITKLKRKGGQNVDA